MSDWREKLNQLHKEFEGGYAEDKIVELEYALFEFEKEIYNKAIKDCKVIVLETVDNAYLIDKLWYRMELLKVVKSKEQSRL